MTAGRGGLHGEVGHTYFQTSKVHAAVMVCVSECIAHSRGGGSGGRWRKGFEKPLWGRKNCLACVHCTLCKRAFGIYESCCDSMCAARDKGAMCMAKRGREQWTVQVWTIVSRCVMRWHQTWMQGASHGPRPPPLVPPSRVQTTPDPTCIRAVRE